MEIGEKLKVFRRNRRLTQKELARILRYSQAYISAIENGRRVPSIKFLKAMEKAFGVGLDWWFQEKMEQKEVQLVVNQLVIKLQAIKIKSPLFSDILAAKIVRLIQNELHFLDKLISMLEKEASSAKSDF